MDSNCCPYVLVSSTYWRSYILGHYIRSLLFNKNHDSVHSLYPRGQARNGTLSTYRNSLIPTDFTDLHGPLDLFGCPGSLEFLANPLLDSYHLFEAYINPSYHWHDANHYYASQCRALFLMFREANPYVSYVRRMLICYPSGWILVYSTRQTCMLLIFVRRAFIP